MSGYVDDRGERERILRRVAAETTTGLDPRIREALKWAVEAIDGYRAIIKYLQEDLWQAEARAPQEAKTPEGSFGAIDGWLGDRDAAERTVSEVRSDAGSVRVVEHVRRETVFDGDRIVMETVVEVNGKTASVNALVLTRRNSQKERSVHLLSHYTRKPLCGADSGGTTTDPTEIRNCGACASIIGEGAMST